MNKTMMLIVLTMTLSDLLLTTLCASDFTDNEAALRRFETLTSAVENNFNQSIATIGGIQDQDRQSPCWKTIRTLKTKLWLQLLNQIDNARELDFNFNDPKNGSTFNVAPSGRQYSSGIDPSSIKEPKVRLEYEEAIIANHIRAIRANFERRLKKQDDQLTVGVAGYFSSVYEKTPDDRADLTESLTAITSLKHREQLEDILHDLLTPMKTE